MAEQDFSIDSLAAYLHLHPLQVTRLAERGRLPGRKVSGQWRFSRAEIHHWMEQRMGLLDSDKLDHVEGVLERSAPASGEAPLSIAELLSSEAIAIPLEARTRSRVISAMADLAAKNGLLWDAKAMAEAVRAREDMQPTALDNGVALLHPRRPMPGILAQALLAIGRTAAGIPFGGSGGVLTDIFFLICSSNDRDHLRTLARISRMISDKNFLDDLRGTQDARSAHQLIVRKDSEFT